MMNLANYLRKNFIVFKIYYVFMCINSIIHLKLISRISRLFFVFISKILFSRRMLCLMDKNGNVCPSKNVTLATQHVLYLENHLVLMAQIFTFSFCKYV